MFDARSTAVSRFFSPVTTSAFALVQRRPADLDRGGHQPDDVLAQRRQLVGQQRAQRAERLSRVVLVEEIGRLDQLRLRVRPVGVQDPVLHVAFGA